MRLFHSVRPVLLMGIFAVVASGASVTYNINFSGGSPTPTFGTFTFDTTAGVFTSFNVTWNGMNFNLLASANRPVSQNLCPFRSPLGVFVLLTSGGQCNGLNLSARWQIFPPNPPGNSSGSQLIFAFLNASNAGYVIGGSDSDTTFIATPTSGTFTVTQAGTFLTGVFTRVRFEDSTRIPFDNVGGGMYLPQTSGGFYSTDGQAGAKATFAPISLNGNLVRNNGPAAGAFSQANLDGGGFGRGIAFATFANTTTSPAVYKANALLSGTSDGGGSAGGAILVFDTDPFNAALNAATVAAVGQTVDQAVGQFLLGPTMFDIPGSTDFEDLPTRLAGALITDTSTTAVFGSGSTILTTPRFTIGAGKSFTVMFDIVAATNAGGQVDFIDTLKPAPTFITDDNGNPATGLAAVADFSSLPPGPAALMIAPPSGALLTADAYTVTATVTDAGGKPNPGAAVKFTVTNGPDAGVSGVGISDSTGTATFTYFGQGGPGADTIQATIGSILSNSLQVTWQPHTVVCTGCYFTIQNLRATLAFNVGYPGGGNTFNYNYRSPSQAVQFAATSASQVSLSGNTATFSGQGTLNGQAGYR